MKIDGGDKIMIASRDDLIEQFPQIDRRCSVWKNAGKEQTVKWGENNLNINSVLSVKLERVGWEYIPVVALDMRGFLI